MIFTVMDIETTGIEADCDIVQFAYARVNEFGELLSNECLYFYHKSYESRWSKEAEKVHGISLEELRTHESEFVTNLKKLYIVLYHSYAVTYNGESFDIPRIRNFLKKFGLPDTTNDLSFDMYKIARSNGVRGKLSVVVDTIGYKPQILDAVHEIWFGSGSGFHRADYDVTCTALLFAYALRNNWISLGNKEKQKARDDYDAAMSDEMSGKTLFNNVKYLIKDRKGKVFEVAICPDKDKYVYYKVDVTNKIGDTKVELVEGDEDGVFVSGPVYIKVTDNSITLDYNWEVNKNV